MKWISILLSFIVCNICCKAQTYNMPVFDRTDTPDLHIDKVEITTDTTFVYCTYYAEEGSWANISKGTYLEDAISHKQYPILKVVGLPYEPDRKIFDYSTEHPVIFCFPKITANKFDFIEKKNEKAFNIYGIDLQKHFSESYSKVQLDRYQEMFDFFMTSNDTVKALGYKEHEYKAIEYIYGRKSIPLCYKIIESSQLFIDTKEYNKALHYSQIEFSIIKDMYHESDTTYLVSMWKLAYCNSLLEKYDESISIYKEVTKILEKQNDTSDFFYEIVQELIRILFIKGEGHADLGQYAEAINSYKEAGDLTKQYFGVGEDYIMCQYRLANSYAENGRIDIAIPIMSEVVDNRKANLDEGDARYIESVNHLAEYYSKNKDYHAAVMMGKEAVRCIKEMKGDNRKTLMIGLHNLAGYYAYLDSFNQARILMTEASNLQKVIETPPLQRLETLSLVAYYSRKCDYTNVYETITEGKDILKYIENEYGKSTMYYDGLNYISSIYEELDSFEIAISLITDYLNYCIAIHDTLNSNNISSRIRLAIDYSQINRLDMAVSIQEDVVCDLYKAENGSHSYAVNLRRLAGYYSANGNYDKSIKLYKKAAMMLDSIVGKNDIEYAETMNWLALDYEKLGEIKKAIKILEDLAERWENQHMSFLGQRKTHDYCIWLNNLAEFYNKNNQYTKAIEVGEKIQSLNHLYQASTEEQSILLGNLANYYANLLDYSKAIKIGKEALRLQKISTGEYSLEYIKRLGNLASFYSGYGMDSLAVSSIKEVIDLGLKIWDDNNHSYGWALINLASIYGNFDRKKAINTLNEVIGIYEKSSELKQDTYEYAQALQNLAYYYGIDGYYEEAISYNKKSISIFSSSLGEGNIEVARGMRIMSEYYAKIHDYNNAITYIQKANNIAKNYIEAIGDSLKSQWESLYLYQLIPFLTSWYTKVAVNNANDKVLSDLYDSILLSKRIALFKKADGYGWKTIQENMSDDDIAIEIICVSPFEIDINDHSESIYALVMKNGYSAPKLIKLFNSYNNVEIMAQGELFWRPLMNELEGVKNIFMSPSGYLSHSYPIENLPIGTLNSITDKYNFYRVSSTEEILKKKNRKDYKKAVIYGGLTYDDIAMYNDFKDANRSGFDPLFNTKSEAANITLTLQKGGLDCTFYSGDDGTEDSFKHLDNQNVDIIHLATHGRYIDSSDMDKEIKDNNLLFIKREENNMPLYEDKALTRSFLVMSGGNVLIKRDSTISSTSNDGILTALEISQMNLKDVDMVVLSACESGLGEFGADSGIIGLQRGFKQAGVNTILMSLDKVDDEATSILMTEFYNNLMNGKSKIESLKKAQDYIRTIDNGKYDKPEYWASFILLDGLD